MKIQVLGVKRIKGTSKKTGNDFDMCFLYGMVPVQVGGSDAVKITGHGFEVAQMELDPEALEAFKSVNFPAQLELQTDSRPFMGEFKTVVCGFEKPAPAARVA
jgi:hypothetical protein